ESRSRGKAATAGGTGRRAARPGRAHSRVAPARDRAAPGEDQKRRRLELHGRAAARVSARAGSGDSEGARGGRGDRAAGGGASPPAARGGASGGGSGAGRAGFAAPREDPSREPGVFGHCQSPRGSRGAAVVEAFG